MFGMVVDSAKLFLTGKLFQDNAKVLLRLALGIGAGAIVIIAIGRFAPVWLAAVAGGAMTGFLQPLLLKDLKYV